MKTLHCVRVVVNQLEFTHSLTYIYLYILDATLVLVVLLVQLAWLGVEIMTVMSLQIGTVQ